MTKTVATTVIVTSVNHVEEGEAEQLKEAHGLDSLEEVAAHMENDVETIIAKRLFGDADELPILDVDTDVYEDWDGAEAEELVEDKV